MCKLLFVNGATCFPSKVVFLFNLSFESMQPVLVSLKRTHVLSLNEYMLNNANVLFEQHFVDSISAVQIIVAAKNK